MDPQPLIDKFDRVAKLRQVQPGTLGSMAVNNARARDNLATGKMAIRTAQRLDRRLDEIEEEAIATLKRGESFPTRGRPRKQAVAA